MSWTSADTNSEQAARDYVDQRTKAQRLWDQRADAASGLIRRMASEIVCITTWIAGDHTKGTAHIRYVHAGLSLLRPGELNCSIKTYSTPEGARRAARREGFKIIRGVAQGHRAALGLLKGAALVARANASSDHTQERDGLLSVAARI